MEPAGRHTGRTDVRLTEAGRAAAVALRPALAGRTISAVFTSPASRAIETAGLAGLSDSAADPDLWEWDYGGYEGLTTDEIRQQRPGWYLWRDGVIPGDADHPGESVDGVGKRADAVLGRVRPLRARGDVALVAHGHLLRVLTARLARAGAGRRPAVPARHRDLQHPRNRARGADHQLLEHPAGRRGRRGLTGGAGSGRGSWLADANPLAPAGRRAGGCAYDHALPVAHRARRHAR